MPIVQVLLCCCELSPFHGSSDAHCKMHACFSCTTLVHALCT